MEVFEDADYESAIIFQKFKTAIPIWQSTCNQWLKNRMQI